MEKAIGYEWYYKEYIYEDKGRWIPRLASDIREEKKAQGIYNMIDIFDLDWNYKEAWETSYETVEVNFDINQKETITYYVFDVINETVEPFNFFTNSLTRQLNLRKGGKFKLILLFFKDDKIFCSKELIDADISKEIKFKFEEIHESQLESYFRFD